jgi:hypothetical protein
MVAPAPTPASRGGSWKRIHTPPSPRAAMRPRPPQRLHVPGQSGEVTVSSSHGQSCSRAHCSTSKCPPPAANLHVPLHGSPAPRGRTSAQHHVPRQTQPRHGSAAAAAAAALRPGCCRRWAPRLSSSRRGRGASTANGARSTGSTICCVLLVLAGTACSSNDPRSCSVRVSRCVPVGTLTSER